GRGCSDCPERDLCQLQSSDLWTELRQRRTALRGRSRTKMFDQTNCLHLILMDSERRVTEFFIYRSGHTTTAAKTPNEIYSKRRSSLVHSIKEKTPGEAG